MPMHPVRRLYTAQYDFPESPEPPAKTMMIAGIPRTGSTLLAIKLWETGAMGAPMEYVNLKNRNMDMVRRLGHGDLMKYWPELKKKRTSPNGVFSFKVFLGDYRQVDKENPDLLSQIESEATVYLTRRDKIAQAVSYSRAFHTGKWFAGAKEDKPPEYNKKNIDQAMGWIRGSENVWEKLFARKDCDPIRVEYEDLVDSPEATIKLIADRMGVDVQASASVDLPDMAVQRDELNNEWKQRYMSETNSSTA